MGIRDTLARLADAPRLIEAHNEHMLTGVKSPYSASPSHLQHIAPPDWLADADFGVTREQALRVPAVARARGLICGTIARLPMRICTAPGVPLDTQPRWLDRSDGALPAWKRTSLLLDDLLFYGQGLLRVERGSDSWPIRIEYVPFARWGYDTDGTIQINSSPDGTAPAWHRANPGSVALVLGPHEGILSFGGPAIAAAAALAEVAARAAGSPIPAMELHDMGDRPLSDTQIEKLVGRWEAVLAKKRRVAYTNRSIELKTHGEQNSDLLVEGRNAAAIDIARLIGVPASLIDASPTDGGSSRAYENMSGRNAEFVDYGLAPFMASLTARFGMDDLCPSGQHVEIDLEGFTSVRPPAAAVPDDGANPAPPAPQNISSIRPERRNPA